MKIVNTKYTFKEFSEIIDKLIFEYFGENKDFECKSMTDETGKNTYAILLHYFETDYNFDRYSLIIKYLDGSSVRSYNSIVFTKNFEKTFDFVYKMCKENDYIDYRFIKEDK